MIVLKHLFLLFLFLALHCTMPGFISAQSAEKKHLYDSLLQALSQSKDDTSKINILYKLAVTFAPSDSAKAFQYANICMRISQQIKWEKGIGLSYLAFGKTYYQITNYTTALSDCDTALSIFKKLNDKKNIATTVRTIAVSYSGLGNYSKGIENNFAALRLFEELNDEKGIENIYNNIGVAYYYLLDYDKAIANYKKALPICKKLDDKYGVASALDNIAIAYQDEGKLDSANIYDLQAIKIFEAINHQPALGRIYANRGDILSRMHDATSAFAFYNRAVEINEELGIDDQLGNDYASIGSLYLELAKDSAGRFNASPELKTNKNDLLKKAQSYFTKAIPLIKNSGDVDFLMSASLLASETEERLGNFKNALVFHKDYTLYKDSIFNDANKRKIEAMETERLTEVKDKQIALQASEVKRQTLIRNIILIAVVALAAFAFLFIFLYNKRRKIKFDKRVMEVEMKALRAQMNPHFIFNSLHSINKYVMDNDKKNASVYLSKFANLMRLILENSREQEVPLEQDLQALELYIQLEALRFKNSFIYYIEVDEKIDKENTLIPPMLLQPFVENSILHGIHDKENGIIKINIQQENEMIRCIVEDNGSGNTEQMAFAYDENKKHKSLGKKIISERLSIINQLKKAKASVNIFDVKDNEDKPGGIRVELLLPLELAFN